MYIIIILSVVIFILLGIIIYLMMEMRDLKVAASKTAHNGAHNATHDMPHGAAHDLSHDGDSVISGVSGLTDLTSVSELHSVPHSTATNRGPGPQQPLAPTTVYRNPKISGALSTISEGASDIHSDAPAMSQIHNLERATMTAVLSSTGVVNVSAIDTLFATDCVHNADPEGHDLSPQDGHDLSQDNDSLIINDDDCDCDSDETCSCRVVCAICNRSPDECDCASSLVLTHDIAVQPPHVETLADIPPVDMSPADTLPQAAPPAQKCIHVLKVGKNKGTVCGKSTINGSTYCKAHLSQQKL